jgi:hypothetical protein
MTSKFSIEIKTFISTSKTAIEYKEFVHYIFTKGLKTKIKDPIWKLLDYLEKETDFYTAPAKYKLNWLTK